MEYKNQYTNISCFLTNIEQELRTTNVTIIPIIVPVKMKKPSPRNLRYKPYKIYLRRKL